VIKFIQWVNKNIGGSNMLSEKISTKSAVIGVIGLGYVGLP